MKGKKVMVFDPKENECNALKCIHLTNMTDILLTNGKISILENNLFVS